MTKKSQNKKLVGIRKSGKRKFNISEITRTITQVLFFSYVSMIALTHMYGRTAGFGWPGNSAGPIDCYCPFGGLETLPQFLMKGQLIGGTDFNDIILLGILVIMILIFAGGFCGYLCPFGSISEWVYKIRKSIFKFEIKIPLKLSSILSYLRYATLILILVITTVKSSLVFAQIDPYRALMHFGRDWTPPMIIMLLSILVLSLLFERPFCNYLCPLGGVIGAVSTVSLTKVTREPSSCTNCKMCDKVCPANLTPSGKLELHRCIMCGKCVTACPVDGALNITFAGKVWK